MNVCAPGSMQRNVTSVVDRNVASPGFPDPSVRSRAMSYPVTSSRRARSAASTWVRLRTPATVTLLSTDSPHTRWRPRLRRGGGPPPPPVFPPPPPFPAGGAPPPPPRQPRGGGAALAHR